MKIVDRHRALGWALDRSRVGDLKTRTAKNRAATVTIVTVRIKASYPGVFPRFE
jgi:hypothetical protein